MARSPHDSISEFDQRICQSALPDEPFAKLDVIARERHGVTTMTKWFPLTAMLSSLILPASEATAMLCAERAVVVESLSGIHAKQTSIALTDSGNLLEVFMSESGTWAVLMSTPTGVACVVATGGDWETLPGESKVARSSGDSGGSPLRSVITR